MYAVELAHETDWEGWRAGARALRLAEIPPDQVTWRVGPALGLFEGAAPPKPPVGAGFPAPPGLFDLAQEVILNRDPMRFDLLYRLLWRARETPRLVEIFTDPDVRRAEILRRQVREAVHKMHAFVRFRRIDAADAPETYLAWFEPPHRVLARGVGFFVDRMANLRFSILTPDACAHWNGENLRLTPGVEAPPDRAEDAWEDYWRIYFASVFNPARLNPDVMTQHMPRRYWRNLPEAEVIEGLVTSAQGRTDAMVRAGPSRPSARARRRTV
jgi:DNA polymerase